MDWGAEPAMSDMEALMWRSEASPRLRSGGVILDILDSRAGLGAAAGRPRMGGDPRAAAARARDRGPAASWPRPRGRSPTTSTSATTCAACALPEGGDDRRRPRDLAGAGDGAVRPRAPAVGGGADRGPAGRPRGVRAQAPPLAAGRRGRHPALRHPPQRPAGADAGEARPPSREPLPAPSPADWVARQVGGLVRGTAGRAGALLELGTDLVLRPEPTIASGLRFARSLRRLAGPPPAEPSPLMARRSLSRRLAVIDMPLAWLRAAGKEAGGSVNDAFLASLVGGLRRYHADAGLTPGDAADRVPGQPAPRRRPARRQPLRRRPDRRPGRRRGPARPHPDDPRARARGPRRAGAGLHGDARARPAPRIPAPLLTRMTERVTSSIDLQASNIPGLARPAYIAGARITHMYPFGPAPGSAVMVTMISHDGICCIGVTADAAAIPDIEHFAHACARASTRCWRSPVTRSRRWPHDAATAGSARPTARACTGRRGSRTSIRAAAVILVHGAAEHGGRYAHVAERLLERGLRRLRARPSRPRPLRRHARDDRPARPAGRRPRPVRQARARGARGAKPFLVGHSMGGAVALTYAIRHGDTIAGLIVSGPAVATEAVPAALKAITAGLSKVAPNLPVFKIEDDAVSRDPQVVHRLPGRPAQPPRQAARAHARRDHARDGHDPARRRRAADAAAAPARRRGPAVPARGQPHRARQRGLGRQDAEGLRRPLPRDLQRARAGRRCSTTSSSGWRAQMTRARRSCCSLGRHDGRARVVNEFARGDDRRATTPREAVELAQRRPARRSRP